MIRLFFENNILVLFSLPFIIGIYFLLNFQTGYYLQSLTPDFGLWSIFFVGNSIILKFLSFIIININALFLNRIFNKNEFLERNSYVVALLYVVTMSFYNSFYTLDGLLLAHLFIILMFLQFLQIKQNIDARNLVFNGCFFAGIAATFHPPIIFGLPFFISMILIAKPFILREFLIGIISFLIPLAYGFIFLWLENDSQSFSFFSQSKLVKLHIDFVITLIIIGILLSLSIFSLSARLQKSSLRLKKQIRIIWIFILLSIILGSINFFYFLQIEDFSLLMIPLSILLSYSFLNRDNGIVAAIVFYLTIFYSVIKFFI